MPPQSPTCCSSLQCAPSSSLALLASVLIVNRGYFAWLAQARGVSFALACVPLHLLYQVYSGVAALVGLTRHVWTRVSSHV